MSIFIFDFENNSLTLFLLFSYSKDYSNTPDNTAILLYSDMFVPLPVFAWIFSYGACGIIVSLVFSLLSSGSGSRFVLIINYYYYHCIFHILLLLLLLWTIVVILLLLFHFIFHWFYRYTFFTIMAALLLHCIDQSFHYIPESVTLKVIIYSPTLSLSNIIIYNITLDLRSPSSILSVADTTSSLRSKFSPFSIVLSSTSILGERRRGREDSHWAYVKLIFHTHTHYCMYMGIGW